MSLSRPAILAAFTALAGAILAAQTGGSPPTGFKNKRPVLGGACKICPWGALGEIVKTAMQPYGYDVQMCYNCNFSAAPLIVADAKLPPPYRPDPVVPELLAPRNATGLGPVDFGVTSAINVWNAYRGAGPYANEKPKANLRLIANIQAPSWLIVAAKKESGITDLAQLRERRSPLTIFARANGPMEDAILAYYKLSRQSIEAAGGHIGNSAADRDRFDVIIAAGGQMATAPEWAVWTDVSQRFNIAFLQLPDDLLSTLARDNDQFLGTIPVGLYRGVERPIRTVVRTGQVLYGRADMPDDFAYTAAKALDEHQNLLEWSHLNFSYNIHTVAKDYGVPLHPGAARYYKERGYAPAPAPQRAPAAALENPKPVFGGACKICPWGALGDIVQNAMQPYGYDVQVCYNCNRADSPRFVADARTPPPYEPDPVVPEIMAPRNAPGMGPVDFGATAIQFLVGAYRGSGVYSREKPRTNLRLIANIQSPNYLMIAAKKETGITDLAQVKAKKWPVRIYLAGVGGGQEADILSYYGLSRQAIEGAGGHVGNTAADRANFDVVIGAGGGLTFAPEWRVWTEITQNNDLVFLGLPDELLDKLARNTEQSRGIVPAGLYRGVDHPIPTLVRNGTVIYARAAMPDALAYEIAKILDERQDLLQWSHLNYSYNIHDVWKAFEVPLHPGAARYYRERHYMP
jgi:TRAP transporter TAXI family solute receptor